MFLMCLLHLLSQLFGLASVEVLPLYTNYEETFKNYKQQNEKLLYKNELWMTIEKAKGLKSSI